MSATRNINRHAAKLTASYLKSRDQLVEMLMSFDYLSEEDSTCEMCFEVALEKFRADLRAKPEAVN